VWWLFSYHLTCVFIAKFGSEKNKIRECLAKLQTKRLIALFAMFALQ